MDANADAVMTATAAISKAYKKVPSRELFYLG
jgi:hypothetical protein